MAETKTREQLMAELQAQKAEAEASYAEAEAARIATRRKTNFGANRYDGAATSAANKAKGAVKDINTKIKDQQIGIDAANTTAFDLQEGQAFGKSIVGDGLTRLGDNEDIISIRERLRANLDGNSAENNLRKSQAIAGLQGQEQAAQRRLTSSLSRSGVKGGTAAAAQLELQAGALSARSRLEENLMLQDVQNQRAALNDFSQFTSSTAQFDIGQEQREKALELEASLGYTNLLATERDSIRQQQAANLLAKQKQSGGTK